MGSKGPPAPSVDATGAEPFGHWFWKFLKDELSPYPGRLFLVLRMTVAATLTMMAIMVFRLPGAALGAYYTLLLSRESPVTTARSAMTVMVAYVLGAAYTFIGALLFVDFPLTHFLWVTFSVFLCFYAIKVTTNYVGSAAFAFILTIAIPIWDTSAPTGAIVAATLWAAGSVSVGLICTIVVEYAFSGLKINDELHTGLVTRMQRVNAFLRCLGKDDQTAGKAGERVEQIAMVGVSRLRRLAASNASMRTDPERRSTTVALVGRIVDLAAALPHLPHQLDPDAKARLRELADDLQDLEQHLLHPFATPDAPVTTPNTGNPVVDELHRTLVLLRLSLSANAPTDELEPSDAASGQAPTFVADALSNPEHLMYSLRGCLAAMLCYVIYNAIAWRGLGTSLATCVITALSSVGSSRQKQVLRLSGAVVGALIFGIGSQVLILPMLDTLAGFTVLFVVVTFISAWFGTASPRLSYFGLQIALAFYLIHLQEYFPQTNLAIARDRVMGIGLGLVMMWLVFDTLGAKPAARVMQDLFASNLKSLAELASPWRDRETPHLQDIRKLRDRISTNFASVNAEADAVLFELGPMRRRDLQLRERLLAIQPRLRSLFFIEIGLLQYRTQAKPSELAPAIAEAQIGFDQAVFARLNGIADAFQGGGHTSQTADAGTAFQQLAKAVSETYGEQPTPRAQGVLAFSANLVEVLDSLHAELNEASGEHGFNSATQLAEPR